MKAQSIICILMNLQTVINKIMIEIKKPFIIVKYQL